MIEQFLALLVCTTDVGVEYATLVVRETDLGKIPDGLNKRVLNVPQKDWDAPVKGVDFDGDDISAISAVSAVFSPEYAIGTLTGFSAEKAAE